MKIFQFNTYTTWQYLTQTIRQYNFLLLSLSERHLTLKNWRVYHENQTSSKIKF